MADSLKIRLDPSIPLQSFLELEPSQGKHVGIIGMFELSLPISGRDFQVEAAGERARANLALKALTVTLEKRQHQYGYR